MTKIFGVVLIIIGVFLLLKALHDSNRESYRNNGSDTFLGIVAIGTGVLVLLLL